MDDGDQPRPDTVARAETGWREQSAASAENYERTAVTAIARPWAERLLDLACGTGIVARLAAGRVGPRGLVAGLDISPAMLAVARSRPAPAGARIHWTLGTAAAFPYRAAAFDTAACAFGLMFFADRALALAELRRVLAPGGRLAVSVWGHAAYSPVEACLTTVLARYTGTVVRQPDAYALGNPEESRRLLVAAGFRAITVDSLADAHRVALEGVLNRAVTPGMDDGPAPPPAAAGGPLWSPTSTATTSATRSPPTWPRPSPDAAPAWPQNQSRRETHSKPRGLV